MNRMDSEKSFEEFSFCPFCQNPFLTTLSELLAAFALSLKAGEELKVKI